MKFRKLIYVQVHRGYFLARQFRSSSTLRRECEALNHPRSLVGDFHAITSTLSDLLREFRGPLTWLVKPRMLIHTIPKAEGGYTNVELRAFKEAGEAAGASFCWICDDKYSPLTDTQLHELTSIL